MEDWKTWAIAGLAFGAGFTLSAIIVSRVLGTLRAQGEEVTYQNIEEWEIVKDPRGRTTVVRGHRTAREG